VSGHLWAGARGPGAGPRAGEANIVGSVVDTDTSTDTTRAIEAVWRMESAKVIAALTRMVRDIGLAEELAQDALVAALEQWPEAGVPKNPGAWLMAIAKRRAIDGFRRRDNRDRKYAEVGRTQAQDDAARDEFADVLERADDAFIPDDLLRLVFTSCHPVLSTEARVALTLRLLGGLSTDEIARAFLVAESTVAQRIVRAKKTLADKKIPFEVPRGDDRAARLGSVLEVIYLVFNEGYSATAGEDWMRPALCAEAMRLGRVLAELAPDEPEVHGLVALMEIQASRTKARTSPTGEPVLLLDQDRSRWDWLLIRRGLAALERATTLGGGNGPYVLQAEIAACHGRARRAEDTDWARIADIYQTLAALTGSPVVELNRAVALSMAYGPRMALSLVEELAEDKALRGYHLLPTVHADLLAKLGRFEEATERFTAAAGLTRNARERELLLARAASTARGEPPDR